MGKRRIDGCLEAFAANVAGRRHARGWTQQQLADEAGLEPRTVRAVEGAHTHPSFETIVVLADALDVGIGELFTPAKLENPRRSGRPRRKPQP